ncbi:hypothetical protein DIURU_002507 [Diutina rugosa]|uniref:J domain-containing protein n=1 Tax=Diutina rugosa TaxID=5481 RepID=A0A642URL1_DIURU|nr:uncharacterized protein DIURU_002507 [Diutina rugosa]KAA8903220.1 hypothetical protein DIURU_002507 [Diutina rugosa]
MVADTEYYDLLELDSSATSLEIKRAYRKLAIRLHPDKNPDDPDSEEKFKRVGEAYQVLSDDQLRSKYDKYGKQESVPSNGFEDPAEFFNMIFGGEAFGDWIGELSLLQELTKSAELQSMDDDGEGKEGKEGEARLLGETSIDEKEKRKHDLEKFEAECAQKKEESRQQLQEKLVNRLSLLTETDMADDVVESFREKMRYEADMLKMESFGLEILHTLGEIYRTKSRIFLKNQTFFGWGGFFHSLGEKGGVVKDTFSAVTSALDAQRTMAEYTKMQEDNEYHAKKEAEAEGKTTEDATTEGETASETTNDAAADSTKPEPETTTSHTTAYEPDLSSPPPSTSTSTSTKKGKPEPVPEKHTQEELQEMEQYLMGKVLAAAWGGTKFEIQGTARGICDNILDDKSVPLESRIARAKALRIIGDVFLSTSRTEAEAEEARVFEELVAKAGKKREKKKKAKPDTEETAA